MNSVLKPKPGARATRVTPPPPRKRQPVTNADWFKMRRQHTKADFLEAIFTRLLEKVRP